MREIEFRGIDNNGFWRYGDLVQEEFEEGGGYPEMWCAIAVSKTMVIPVAESTVGQYTGLKDKNGKKIFEGDILECEGGVYFSETYRGLVEFEEGVFVAKGSTVDFQPEMFNDCKIIGNICDNPDLIE